MSVEIDGKPPAVSSLPEENQAIKPTSLPVHSKLESRKRLKSTSVNLSTIEIKPSTELIPDEYEHVDNGKGVVHLFYGKKEIHNMTEFKKTFENFGYSVPDNHIHKLSDSEALKKTISEIANANYEDKSCFMLVMLGEAKLEKSSNSGKILLDNQDSFTIASVWSEIIESETLKNKPKIFIFHATKKRQDIVTDAASVTPSKHELPIEADLLVVYRVSLDDDFVSEICDLMEGHGERDDLLSILALMDIDCRPVVISTLTRKFYVTPSKTRDHHWDIDSDLTNAKKILQEMHEIFEKLKSEKSKIEDVEIKEETKETYKPKKERNKSATTSQDNLAVPPSNPRQRSPSTSEGTRPRLNSKGKKPVWKP